MANLPQRYVYSYWRSQWKDSGWASLVMPLIDFCEEHNIEITCLKEKFSGLRCYTGPADEKIVAELDAQIDAAEEASYSMCDICAAPGRRCSPTGGWLRTLCEPCDLAEKARWSEDRRKYETLVSEAK